MPIERSAGIIVFYKEKEKIFYLLLEYPPKLKTASYWDLVKGHIEKGEKLEETAQRETIEETGLKEVKIISGFKETIKYFFQSQGKTILKFVTFFVGQTWDKEVSLSHEHLSFKWLPYSEALKQLTHKEAKNILKKANDFISRKSL